MQREIMTELEELTVALVNVTEDVVRAKKDDGKLSTVDIVKVGFSNAESLLKGIAGCDAIPSEVKQSKVEDWTHLVDTVASSIDSPKAKAISEKSVKVALAMKELYDEIAA